MPACASHVVPGALPAALAAFDRADGSDSEVGLTALGRAPRRREAGQVGASCGVTKGGGRQGMSLQRILSTSPLPPDI